MEDFGEYTPPDAVSACGRRGVALHNAYPRAVPLRRRRDRPPPAAAARALRALGLDRRGALRDRRVGRRRDDVVALRRPGARRSASRWARGSRASAAGAPTSAATSPSGEDRLTPELLARWIELGAVTGAMRSKGGGIAIPAKPRPQIWEPAMLPVWRRWAKLRTQLLPYWQAADADLPAPRDCPRCASSCCWTRPGRAPPGSTTSSASGTTCSPRRCCARARGPGACGCRAGRGSTCGAASATCARPAAWPSTARACSRGAGAVTLPAPREELPLLARAGTVLTCCPRGGHPRPHRAGARPRPRGRSRRPPRRGRVPARAQPPGLRPRRGLVVGRAPRRRLAAGRPRPAGADLPRPGRPERRLRRPLRPRAVLVDGRPLRPSRWRFDARRGVLRATVRLGRRGVLVVRG